MVRRRWQMGRKAVRIGISTGVALFFVLVSYGSLFALIARHGGAAGVGPTEVIDEDIYLFGDEITVEGTVNGSLVAVGKSVTVRGRVKGDALIAAGDVIISGEVAGGVKTAGRSVVVEGALGGDLIAAGNRILLQKGSRVKGDLVFGGRSVRIDGVADMDAFGGAGSVEILGSVRGNAKLWVRSLALAPSARIGGNLSYISDDEAKIEPGASIVGKVSRRAPEYSARLKRFIPFVLVFGFAGKVAGFFMALVAGLALVLVFPRWVNGTADALQWDLGTCAGWGALIFFASPLGITVAFATIIGIPLAVIALFLYIIALYVSQALVGFFIGRTILKLDEETAGKGPLFGAMALGLFIIRLVRFIPVAGWLALFAVVLFGLGAIAVAGRSASKAVK
jgi:cytoskeletal protein CcmA (bactofilin family)